MNKAIAGVYMIRSLKNGASYIGSSTNIGRRFACHVRGISNGRHQNPRIGKAFAGHARDEIELKILERKRFTYETFAVGVKLCACERKWIVKLQPTLNVHMRRPFEQLATIGMRSEDYERMNRFRGELSMRSMFSVLLGIYESLSQTEQAMWKFCPSLAAAAR